MQLKNYSWRLSREIRIYLFDNGISVSQFAQKLNMSRGSLHGKLAGRTSWKVEELERLAELGVRVPSFNQPRGGEGRA